MNIVNVLEKRYATKKFDSKKKVSPELVEKIEKSLVLTASSFGLQPWKFVFITNQEIKEKILPFAFNQTQVVDCSHLIILCRKNIIDEKEIDLFLEDMAQKNNIPFQNEKIQSYGSVIKKSLLSKSQEALLNWANKQIYIALGNLLTVCAVEGIDSCPMEGFQPKAVDDTLSLKKHEISSVVMCPIGYRSSQDDYAKKPKVRFSVKQTILKFD